MGVGVLCRIVVQEAAVPILNRYGIKSQEYQSGYYTAQSIEVSGKR